MPRLNAGTIVVQPGTLEGVFLPAGSEVPDWADGLVGEHLFASDEEATVEKGYADLKVDALKAAIIQRNEGREEADLISTDGLKADLIAALEADDARQAEVGNSGEQ